MLLAKGLAAAGGVDVRQAVHRQQQRNAAAVLQQPVKLAHSSHSVTQSRSNRVVGRRVAMHSRLVMAAAVAGSSSSTQAENLTAVSAGGLPRTAVVGVLGGGQLGRMMALAAANMGVSVKFLDPAEGAAAAVAAQQTVGHFRNEAAIAGFAAGCDVLTVEIEHINADAVEEAGKAAGVDLEPTPTTLRIIQDKHAQKKHFAAAGVPIAPFADINSQQDLEATAADFGFPLMLKSKRFAYDGRGNFVVKSASQLSEGVEALGGFGSVYAEKWAPFVKELAVMVVRSRDGSVVSYPVVETIHKDNICHVTEAPANVPEALQQRAREVAEQAVAALYGAGIFGVEMFLLPDGSIFLNEVAPRPHNSGHYTQNGCVSSQFENHVRAVLGWPLGDTSLNCGCCIMVNLLGEADGDEGVKLAHAKMAAAYKTPGASVHWYDKPGTMQKGRKIGHINIVAPTREEARQRLAAIEAAGEQSLRRSDAAAQQAGLISAAAAAAAAAAGSNNNSQPHRNGPGGVSAAGGSSSGSSGQQLAGSRSVKAAAAGAGGASDSSKTPKVGIIMGSDSDLPTMKAAEDVLREFGVPCELTIVSAHRTPDRMMTYARTAHERGLQVIIAGAGGAAHLPGMVAAMTPLPVVGVPVKPSGAYLDGMDALLSIVQMPKGVPVATVAIGNAANAGLLAVRILASTDPALLQKMLDYQTGMKDMVLQKAAKVEAERA